MIAYVMQYVYDLAQYTTTCMLLYFVPAILFAFCPYFYSHSAHVQLLMAGGIPLSMFALHRLADSPSIGRGVVLGVALLERPVS